ncbi:MAG: nicotinate (nicotinamide) nucleotide adenylyltransferase [Bacteroidales bacterium]
MGKKTGLFFGSFDPIHIGHLIIAEYMLNETDLQEIWFVVSPQNPHKINEKLSDKNTRLQMVDLSIAQQEFFISSAMEFDLPAPHYTYKTLLHAKKKYPGKEFVLIIGGDNLESFHRWKKHREIMEMVEIYAYPRRGFDQNQFEMSQQSLRWLEAPRIEISSSYIREKISEKKTPGYMLHPEVLQFIQKNNLYT